MSLKSGIDLFAGSWSALSQAANKKFEESAEINQFVWFTGGWWAAKKPAIVVGVVQAAYYPGFFWIIELESGVRHKVSFDKTFGRLTHMESPLDQLAAVGLFDQEDKSFARRGFLRIINFFTLAHL